MQTIEERADALYPISDDDYNECIGYYTESDLKIDLYNAYIKGATEQKQIDDEEYRKDMTYVNIKKQELIDKACTEVEDLLYRAKRSCVHSIPQLVEKFRKAMES